MEELISLLPKLNQLLEGTTTEDIVPRRTAVTEAGGDTFVPKGAVETVIENAKQNVVDRLFESVGLVTDAGYVKRNADLNKPRVEDYTTEELKIPEGAATQERGSGLNKGNVLVGQDRPTGLGGVLAGIADLGTFGIWDFDQEGNLFGGEHGTSGYGRTAPEATEKFDAESYNAALDAYNNQINNQILTGNPVGDVANLIDDLQSLGVTQANVNKMLMEQGAAVQEEIIKNQLQQNLDYTLASGEALSGLPMTRAKLQQTAANIAETQAKATAALAESAAPRNILYDVRKFVG